MVYDEISDPFRRLVRIMQRLQEPGGCPWDLEQTHESLKPYMIEEAYEALDAIDAGDRESLKEELGDVLLQVIFHSVLSARNGGFTIDQVCEGTSTKMVRRHPHVFGETEAATVADVLKQWETLKKQERADKKNENAAGTAFDDSQKSPNGKGEGLLAHVPRNLPALLRAQRLQEKAARVGFDWPDALPVLDKIEEEIGELRNAINSGTEAQKREEFGDLMFALVNMARFLGIDAEDSTREADNKFQRRFEYMEKRSKEIGRPVDSMTLEEMDVLWNEIRSADKEQGKGETAG